MAIRLSGSIVVAGVLALMWGGRSGAAPILTLKSGATTVNVADNGAGDSDPRPDYIRFVGPVGTFTATVTAGGSSNSPGATFANGKSLGVLQLQSAEVQNNGTSRQALDIVFSDGDFVPAPRSANKLSSSTTTTFTNPTAGDSVSFQNHLNRSNVSPSFDSTFTTGPQNGTASGTMLTESFSSTNEMSVPGFSAGNPLFSLTQHAIISL